MLPSKWWSKRKERNLKQAPKTVTVTNEKLPENVILVSVEKSRANYFVFLHLTNDYAEGNVVCFVDT